MPSEIQSASTSSEPNSLKNKATFCYLNGDSKHYKSLRQYNSSCPWRNPCPNSARNYPRMLFMSPLPEHITRLFLHQSSTSFKRGLENLGIFACRSIQIRTDPYEYAPPTSNFQAEGIKFYRILVHQLKTKAAFVSMKFGYVCYCNPNSHISSTWRTRELGFASFNTSGLLGFWNKFEVSKSGTSKFQGDNS